MDLVSGSLTEFVGSVNLISGVNPFANKHKQTQYKLGLVV